MNGGIHLIHYERAKLISRGVKHIYPSLPGSLNNGFIYDRDRINKIKY